MRWVSLILVLINTNGCRPAQFLEAKNLCSDDSFSHIVPRLVRAVTAFAMDDPPTNRHERISHRCIVPYPLEYTREERQLIFRAPKLQAVDLNRYCVVGRRTGRIVGVALIIIERLVVSATPPAFATVHRCCYHFHLIEQFVTKIFCARLIRRIPAFLLDFRTFGCEVL